MLWWTLGCTGLLELEFLFLPDMCPRVGLLEHMVLLILVFKEPSDCSLGEGNGTPHQYSCLENPMDRGVWQAAVHGVAKSQTWLSGFTFTFHFYALEKDLATHSNVLAWRIPGMGLHRVRHDWSDLAVAVAADCSSQWSNQLTFPPAVYEGSLFSTPSSVFIICILSDEPSDQNGILSFWFSFL